ncbi:arginase family protein [Sphingomonas sp. ABOLD]|nr:arginase family protein [Sphingomonas sp. ABOLD]
MNPLADMVDTVFVTVPGLRIIDRGETISVANLAAGTEKSFHRDIVELLEFFARPRPLHEWFGRAQAQARDVPTAIRHALLVAADQLLTQTAAAIGGPLTLSKLLEPGSKPDIVLFGAPTDVASSGRGGARAGPSEIRRHAQVPFAAPSAAAGKDRVCLDFEMRRSYAASLPSVGDLGDVAGLVGEGIASYGPRLSLLSEILLSQGCVPAMLGGDHSCTAFAIEAHLRHWPALGILHFDAHHDLWPPAGAQFHYVTHANVFHRALARPNLRVLRQFGLRTFETAAAASLHHDPRVDYVSARELRQLSTDAVFAGLPRDIPYYLSFDIDCIDPIHAPETGTPLPGGISYHQALDLVDAAAQRFRLVGWDIVEVGQSERATNGAALCAAGLLRRLLLAGVPFDPLASYTRRTTGPAEGATGRTAPTATSVPSLEPADHA